MKKTLLFILTLCVTCILFAQNFTSGGINYKITSATTPLTVEVATNVSFGVVTIPDNVTNGNYTYSVTSIGDKAFYNCSDLTSVTIPTSVTTIGFEAFYNCLGLTSFIIPNSVTSIKQSAFESCKGLTSITIPNSINNIGVLVFSSCTGLLSINIPKSVTSIDKYAFQSCSSLNSVTVNWTTPLTIIPAVFYNLTLANITLYVPVGTETAYKSTAVWKDFKSINTLGASNFEIANNFKIYPNPCYSNLTIDLQNLENSKVEVSDMNGRQLFFQKLNTTSNNINVEKLASGVYVFKVTSDRGSATSKVIKK